MRWACLADKMGLVLLAIASLALPSMALGQTAAQDKSKPSTPNTTASAKADVEIQAIDDDYSRQLLQLDQRRLEQLGRLASQQKPDKAAATYERLFRLAIAGDLFKDAEAAAGKVIEQGTPSHAANALAYLVKVIAEVDRGAFEESLRTLRQALTASTQERRATAARAVLAPAEVIEICEVYYQRLVDANQFAIAREAFRLVLEQPYRPALKDFVANRLKRIELVGKPAPPIQGTDLDGKKFNLADDKGKVVLVVFWASWCLPNAAQVSWLEEVEHAYHNQGLQVLGINVDVQEEGGQKLETVLPNIRRFLLDYNIPWPTLVNGTGDHDYAKAYGIADIPANVLIGRDGKVVQIDLSRKNLETVISRQLGL
jgi:thiol-disulfide isomerase/thioredoxin